jgi:hypothetical protein
MESWYWYAASGGRHYDRTHHLIRHSRHDSPEYPYVACGVDCVDCVGMLSPVREEQETKMEKSVRRYFCIKITRISLLYLSKSFYLRVSISVR